MTLFISKRNLRQLTWLYLNLSLGKSLSLIASSR